MQNLLPVSSETANLLDPPGLEANRNGEITAAQNKRLNARVGWGAGCSMLVVAFFLLLMGVGIGALFVNFGSGFSFAWIPFLIMGSTILVVIALFGWQVWKLLENGIKLKRDRENRAIRQAQGQVAFDKKGYVFKVSERNLVLPAPENTGGLLPGTTYRVYYLDETGFILSAEESYPANPAQVRAALQDILATANHFTPEDLEHNRNGDLTPSQRLKPLGQVLFGAVMGLPALAVGILLLFPVLNSPGRTELDPAQIIPLLMLGFFILFAGWTLITGLLNMFISSLAQIEGTGHKEKRTSGGKNRSTRYYYVINGQSFQVSKSAYTALIDGLGYRLYYLPRTKKLVSLEPIDASPNAPQYNLNLSR